MDSPSLFDAHFRLAGYNANPLNTPARPDAIVGVPADTFPQPSPSQAATTYGAWYTIPTDQFVLEYDSTIPFIRLAYTRFYWKMPDGSRLELKGEEVRYTFNNFTGNASRVSVMLTGNTVAGFERWGRRVDTRNVQTGSDITRSAPKAAGIGDVLDTVSLVAVVAGLGLIVYLQRG